MTNIVIVFPKLEDGKNIRNVLVKNGFPVAAVCSSGAQALQYADDLHNGIVISGYRLTDMLYLGLHENLSEEFDLLLIASMKYLSEIREEKRLRCVAMPLKVHELIRTVSEMVEESERKRKKRRLQPRERSGVDRAVIGEAKQILMEKKNMTEEEAHHYLQKQSMDNGVNMLETAQMIISIMK